MIYHGSGSSKIFILLEVAWLLYALNFIHYVDRNEMYFIHVALALNTIKLLFSLLLFLFARVCLNSVQQIERKARVVETFRHFANKIELICKVVAAEINDLTQPGPGLISVDLSIRF